MGLSVLSNQFKESHQTLAHNRIQHRKTRFTFQGWRDLDAGHPGAAWSDDVCADLLLPLRLFHSGRI